MYLVNLIPLKFALKFWLIWKETQTDKGENAEGAIIALSFLLPPPPSGLKEEQLFSIRLIQLHQQTKSYYTTILEVVF